MSETVTQLLDRYDDDLMELARLSTQGMFDKDLYASASEARQQIVDLVAAARRECEAVNEEAERQAGVICNLNTDLATVTRERDEAKDFLASYRGTFTREKERADTAEADLATSRAALEDVRRVDECSGTVFRDEHGEWTRTPGMCDECDPGPITSADFEGGYSSPECDNEEAHKITRADSIAALGRALAQEAGDDTP